MRFIFLGLILNPDYCKFLQVKQWNIPLRKCVRTTQAHEGYVRGMTFSEDSETLITIGDDKNIRFWSTKPPEGEEGNTDTPNHSVITKVSLGIFIR